jgi:putative addiction module killer protein
MIEIRLYLDERGRSPFERWRADLDAVTRARISRALERVAEGNMSNVKGVTGGVSELKIDAGPGYRVYFGRAGDRIVVLLGGGTKKRQQRDIADAVAQWVRYKLRSS